MAQAGATQEEIEEMMVLLLSQGTGVSPDFIDAVKDAMQFGGKLPSYSHGKKDTPDYNISPM